MSVQKPVAPAATWLRTKPGGDAVPQGRKLVLYAATLHDPKSMMKDATVPPEKVYEPGPHELKAPCTRSCDMPCWRLPWRCRRRRRRSKSNSKSKSKSESMGESKSKSERMY